MSKTLLLSTNLIIQQPVRIYIQCLIFFLHSKELSVKLTASLSLHFLSRSNVSFSSELFQRLKESSAFKKTTNWKHLRKRQGKGRGLRQIRHLNSNRQCLLDQLKQLDGVEKIIICLKLKHGQQWQETNPRIGQKSSTICILDLHIHWFDLQAIHTEHNFR